LNFDTEIIDFYHRTESYLDSERSFGFSRH